MADEKQVRQVAKGTEVKKTLADKVGETFLSEDTRTVKNYIIWDILIPGLKNAFADVVIGGIEMALFGNSRGRSRRGGESHVSYSGYYDRDRRSSSGRMERDSRSERPDRIDFSGIYLDSRGEAEEVLVEMDKLIKKYDEVTVADLYSLVGITSNHTHNKWGWTDSRDLNYRRSGRGYVLDFAKPIYLGD